HWTHPELAVSLDQVKKNFERYGLLDGQVNFLPGWFRDTLTKSPIRKLALLHVDGDMYESTIQVLQSLYDKVSPGGYVIIDDYGAVEGCRRAVDDFREQRGINGELKHIDWTEVRWQVPSDKY
ncbi:MAG: putative O-methyltransferase, partial [Candidatus Angelobacter sp.]|nr:putative O-methyltransferase [Candidatus Angelobacter sp.]